MKVIGDIMLFKNDFGYSTSISNKKPDGTYENMAIVVQFRKGDMEAQKIPTKTKINIKDGFLTFYKSTAGDKKLKLVILDYEIADGIKVQEDPFAKPDAEIDGVPYPPPDDNWDVDDLPF